MITKFDIEIEVCPEEYQVPEDIAVRVLEFLVLEIAKDLDKHNGNFAARVWENNQLVQPPE